jgi:hypothetical protein
VAAAMAGTAAVAQPSKLGQAENVANVAIHCDMYGARYWTFCNCDGATRSRQFL